MRGLILTALLSLSIAQSYASDQDLWDDDWGEEETSQWTGFLEAGYGYRFDKDPLFANQETLNEVRLFAENSWQKNEIKLNVKAEGWYDGVLGSLKGNIRELSLNFSAFGNTDFKIGRQVSTWGTGDLLFLNDQFPKGWNSYFNGRDDVYVKAPANAIRVTSFLEWFNVDFQWTPLFTPDDYINGDRFSFYNPILDQNIGGSDVIDEVEPSSGEFAIRLFKNYQGIEYALYGYKGFDKRPLGMTQDFKPTFHKRNLIGASARGSLFGGIANMEITYENALEDPNGSNPLVNNSLVKYLIGFESEWLPKLNVGFQLYRESIQDYAALINNSFNPNVETNKNRDWLTNRIRYTALQEKLTLNLFSFYSLTDKDYFLRWNLNYRQDDNWNYIFGINQLDGKDSHTFFAQFEKASNAYFRIRYNF